MLAACLVVMGGCFSFGWWKLSRHYDRMVDAALKRILSVNAGNQRSFHPADRDERPYPRSSQSPTERSGRFPENSPWLWTMLKTWPSRTLPTGRERQFISRNPPIENRTCRDNRAVGGWGPAPLSSVGGFARELGRTRRLGRVKDCPLALLGKEMGRLFRSVEALGDPATCSPSRILSKDSALTPILALV